MADVENPEEEEEEAAAAAEPSECSRRVLACAVGLVYIALLLVSTHAMELQDSHPESKDAAVVAVAFLAFLIGHCFAIVLIAIVIDCIKGPPDGYRLLVDDLILSDRFILVEFAHQFVRRMDHNQHGDA